jgi:adrenodoxin-NADP+ reductase
MAILVKPMKVAIIGSGPSAFYSAARLLAHASEDVSAVKVHMYERLPTPNGLVRYGVAPDHPEVKNVEHKFAQVAQHPSFKFLGNVNVVADHGTTAYGNDAAYSYPLAARIALSDLLPHYTHVLLAYGCSFARGLGIPGSDPGDLLNVHSALDFVNWYNGHPAAHDATFLRSKPWRSVHLDEHMRHATIVGAGNVALDVARILLRAKSTLHDLFTADSQIKARAALRETDVPESVLQTLSGSQIEQVDIVARRGPAQVAFTNKELREMMELQDVSFIPPSKEHMALANEQIRALEEKSKGILPDGEQNSSAEQLAAASEVRVRKRLLSSLDKGSRQKGCKTSWKLDFFKSPRELLGRSDVEEKKLTTVDWNVKCFQRMPSIHDREQPWSGGSEFRGELLSTGATATTDTDFLVASVGYRAAPLEGGTIHHEPALAWNHDKGVLPTKEGRVLGEDGKVRRGIYAAGWLARGPVGVIASTRIDANSVVEQMLEDWNTSKGTCGLHSSGNVEDGTPAGLSQSGRRVVGWDDWLRLNQEELDRGTKLGKLREKILTVQEMLEVIG